jgi:DNA-directed RNA polymerase subunit F
MMTGEILSDIEKNPEALRRMNSLDPTRIKKMKEELQNEFTKPTNNTYQDFQKQVKNMPRSAQEKILLAKKPGTQIDPNTSIEKDVIDIIIQEAAEN